VGRQRIFLGIGDSLRNVELIINLRVEEHNREDMYEVLKDSIDLIYDGEYDEEGEDE
jgi:hypothetical protein